MSKSKLPTVLATAAIIQLGIAIVSAQTNTQSSSSSSSSFFYQGNQFEVTPEIGTTGYGASANWRFANHLGVRAGFDYLHYSLTHSEQQVSYHGTLRLQSEPTALDLYPSKNSSFHVSVGALWNQNKASGSGQPTSDRTITLNGTTYNLPPGASVDAKVNQPSVMPYVGIGGDFFYFDKGHHVSLGGELGVAYGTWSTSISQHGLTGPVGSNVNTDVSAEQSKVNHTLNNVPFWPILKLGIGISF